MWFHEALPLTESPAVLFRRFADAPGAFLLESALPSDETGHWSFLGAWPSDRLVLDEADRPLEILKERLAGDRVEEEAPVPFAAGWVGTLSYDLGRRIERLPSEARRDLAIPLLCLGRYEAVLAHDGRSGAWSTAGRSEEACRRLVERARGGEHQRERAGATVGEFRADRDPGEFLEAIRRVIEYIRAGDVFQVNLSQRFEAPFSGSPTGLYERLREESPAPFSALLPFPGGTVISRSPERFLQVAPGGRRVWSCPIKGTRPRGRTREEDERLARELCRSEKDRAELAMIVDLIRNDLGRVAETGTVQVTEDRVLHSFPTVHHLISTVACRLAPGRDRVDLLRAAFPGGSITGAPKIRAMEIIEELEPTRRSIYTGAIGYFGDDGAMDLNIAIRTAILQKDRLFVQVGGGICVDSNPNAELQETLDKAEAFFRVVG